MLRTKATTLIRKFQSAVNYSCGLPSSRLSPSWHPDTFGLTQQQQQQQQQLQQHYPSHPHHHHQVTNQVPSLKFQRRLLSLSSQKFPADDPTDDTDDLISLSTSDTLDTTTADDDGNVVDDNDQPFRHDHLNDVKEDEDDSGWIRPSRPLVGDQGKPLLYKIQQAEAAKQLQAERKLEAATAATATAASVETAAATATAPSTANKAKKKTVDWMKTRRSMLLSTPNAFLENTDNSSNQQQQHQQDPNSKKNDQPEQPQQQQQLTDKKGQPLLIPIRKHTLLTEAEIRHVVEACGGVDPVTVLEDEDPSFRRWGGGLVGQMVVTAPSHRHLVQISTLLVRQLRLRQLQDCGVLSAIQGPQGNRKNPHEHWMVVDCGNFVVHVQRLKTRHALNLPALWSGKDPICQINTANEEELDAYMEQYPIPDDYGTSIHDDDDGHNRATTTNRMKALERNRYTGGHHKNIAKRRLKKQQTKERRKGGKKQQRW